MGDLRQRYLNWLSEIVNLPGYSMLINKLFNTEFIWTIPFDANRADDGIQLRYRFGRIFNIPDPIIFHEIDLGMPCSILEMIIALAVRCEEQIMGDESIGDRTQVWIHSMLDNLGLFSMSDGKYNDKYVDDVIYIFTNRQYDRTGKGGLFRIDDLDPSRDMRTAELWYQMCWYMNEY